jgi:hypothetical protein
MACKPIFEGNILQEKFENVSVFPLKLCRNFAVGLKKCGVQS